MTQKNYSEPTLKQLMLLSNEIKKHPSELKWKDDGYKLKTWHQDDEGYMYDVMFYYNNGFLTVKGEHRLGGGLNETWNQEGVKVNL